MIITVLISSIILNLILFTCHKSLAKINNIYDFPDNNRKIHDQPVPLIGGLIFYINILIFLFLNYFFNFESFTIFKNSIQLLSFVFIISLFFFLGRVDDKKDLNSFMKFIIMSMFIIISIIFDKELLITELGFSFINKNIYLGNFSFFFTVLCFLLFINAFNMLDGINAQAATYTLIVLFIFILRDTYLYFLIFLNLCIFIYIFFNLKNSMFLGDSGSLILGFFISYICIKAYNQGHILYSDEIYLIMCIPGYELLRLFIKRIFIGRNPFSADNNHMHHYFMNKYNFFKTFLMMQILIFLPILTYLVFKNFYFSFLLSLVAYFLILFFLTKKG